MADEQEQLARFIKAGQMTRDEQFAEAFQAYLALAREGVGDAQAMVAIYMCSADVPEDIFGPDSEAPDSENWDLDIEAAAWDMIGVLNKCPSAGDIMQQATEDAEWHAAMKARAAELQAQYPACVMAGRAGD